MIPLLLLATSHQNVEAVEEADVLPLGSLNDTCCHKPPLHLATYPLVHSSVFQTTSV